MDFWLTYRELEHRRSNLSPCELVPNPLVAGVWLIQRPRRCRREQRPQCNSVYPVLARRAGQVLEQRIEVPNRAAKRVAPSAGTEGHRAHGHVRVSRHQWTSSDCSTRVALRRVADAFGDNYPTPAAGPEDLRSVAIRLSSYHDGLPGLRKNVTICSVQIPMVHPWPCPIANTKSCSTATALRGPGSTSPANAWSWETPTSTPYATCPRCATCGPGAICWSRSRTAAGVSAPGRARACYWPARCSPARTT